MRHSALWLAGLLPLALLGGLLAVMVWWEPAKSLVSEGTPPVERLSFQRVVLDDQGIAAEILNDGPDQVTIAQVQVDEAYWTFETSHPGPLRHLERTMLRIPYPWVAGESHTVKVLTSTGVAFEYVIPVAVATPRPGARFFAVFTLIGVYVGVIPVVIGLLWYPFVTRLGRTGLEFVLALTVGLLVFLAVDGAAEGLDAVERTPGSFQGTALFALGMAGAYLTLESFGSWLRRRRSRVPEDVAGASGFVLALLIAIGIGLHNFGEGLAIGASFGLGEATLGALLIIGFTLHNTTEGLAIVAPLASAGRRAARPPLGDLAKLGFVGGAPTILGAWIGGLVYSPVWSVFFLALGVGAIVQVVVQITRQMAAGRPVAASVGSAPVLTGLFTGFSVMYVTGLIIG